MKIVLIRHGLTAGNLEKRYIGRTDEALYHEGIARLKTLEYPQCEVLICSPMKRCIETAELIFHGQEAFIVPGLRECDFGAFEGKNYIELTGDTYYQKWIESGGNMPFPKGESLEDFRNRCSIAFEETLVKYKDNNSAAFVVHGGTIMSILEKYAVPHRDYYDWHCENGHGYICDWDGTELHITEKI